MKLRWSRAGLAALALAVLGAGALALGLALVPGPEELLAAHPPRSLEIVDRHGILLRLVPDAQGRRFIPLDPAAPPLHLVRAVVAAEDRRFFSHPGVDVLAAARAARQNLSSFRVVSGASTLSMQLARLLEPRPRGWPAKLRQILVALRLERELSKGRILAEYLSRVPLGNRLVGFEAASRVYFGKPASQLSPAEAATLAAVPRAPSRANPWRGTEELARRRTAILDRLHTLGWLAEESWAAARVEKVVLADDPYRTAAPHFLARVIASAPPASGAVRLESTLDLALQEKVSAIARRRRAELDSRGVGQIAVIVVDPRTGEVLALEGSGREPGEPGSAIDATRTLRQPGSALKPFTYALAFDRGLTPATLLDDIPQSFTWSSGTWTPRNYDGRFHGPLRAREALACSVNIPAALVLKGIGPEVLLDALRDAGVTTLQGGAEDYGLSLTLGGGEVRLDELTAAYAALLAGGTRSSLRFWRRALDRRGEIAALPEPSPPLRIVSATAAALVADILADPQARAPAFGLWSVLRLPFAAAVKTGTSEGFRDNWCLGGTNEVVAGVWAGQADGSPMGEVSGVTGAGSVWSEVMLAWADHAHPQEDLGLVPTLPPLPRDIERRKVCALSGAPAGPNCPATVLELFPRGCRIANAPCSWHAAGSRGQISVRWPARYRPWAAAQGLLDKEVASASLDPPSRPPAGPRDQAALSILTPAGGDSFLISGEIPREFQTLELTLSAPGAPSAIAWLVDGREWQNAPPPYTARWPLEPGTHRFEAASGALRSRPVTVTVFGPAPAGPGSARKN